MYVYVYVLYILSLSLYIYIYIYTCVYIYIYIYVYVCVCVYIYIYIYNSVGPRLRAPKPFVKPPAPSATRSEYTFGALVNESSPQCQHPLQAPLNVSVEQAPWSTVAQLCLGEVVASGVSTHSLLASRNTAHAAS